MGGGGGGGIGQLQVPKKKYIPVQQQLLKNNRAKVIGFATTLHDWLKNSRYFFIQSEVKPKPLETHSHAFSRASRQLHVISSSFNWLSELCVIWDRLQ